VEVAGSNPVSPTNLKLLSKTRPCAGFFVSADRALQSRIAAAQRWTRRVACQPFRITPLTRNGCCTWPDQDMKSGQARAASRLVVRHARRFAPGASPRQFFAHKK